MRTLSRLLLPIVATVSLAACAGGDSAKEGASGAATPVPQGSASGSSDLADIASYRLTMEKIDRYFAAQRNLALAAKAMSPDEREALENSRSMDTDASLDDLVRGIERVPQMRDAIRKGGLSTREFGLITFSMLQSGMATAMLAARPNENQDSLVREMKASLDNIRFFQRNEAEITQKQEALQAELKAMGVDEEQ